jgi:serine protease Do
MSWKRMLYVIFVVIVAGASALAGAAAGGYAVYRAVHTAQSNEPAFTIGTAVPIPNIPPIGSPAETQTLNINTTNVQTTIEQSVQQVGPSVVTVVGTIPGQMTFFGPTGDQTVSGSGIFISDQGYLITNNHVIEGTKEVNIVLADGTREKASLVGADQYSDVAVLKAEGKVPAVAKLGNSDVLDPGETVIAIGSPLGNFKNTVTVGVVSATGRSIESGRGYQLEGMIQTDAAINEGNSGGPLVNLAGEVVAINTLIVRGSGSGTVAEGLGFAIPINTVRAVAEQIIKNGFIARPYMGIRWQLITPDIASMYNLPVQWGIFVTEVASGSPAAQAGIQPNDIIIKIGDVSIDETHSYLNALFQYKPGDQVEVVVRRDGNELQLNVTLGESNTG